MQSSTAPSLAVHRTDLPAFLFRPVPAPPPHPLGHRLVDLTIPNLVVDFDPPKSPGHRAASLAAHATPAAAPWFAIRTALGKEVSVVDDLEDLPSIDETYCPRYVATWVSRNQTHERLVPYLATYVFARWPTQDFHTWHRINDHKHVVHVLGGATPSPIRDKEIARLRDVIGDGRTIALPPTAWVPDPDDHVRVTTGPFATYNGVVTVVDPPFIHLKISGLFSRETVLSLPISWCEPLDTAIEHLATPSDKGMAQRSRKRGRRGGSFRQSSKYHLAVS